VAVAIPAHEAARTFAWTDGSLLLPSSD